MDVDESLVYQNDAYYSELRPILAGAFRLSPTPVPYFQSILSLRAIVTELEPIEGIPSDVRETWGTKLAFARTFNPNRVGDELVRNYLRRRDPLKFFSSLCAVLLPIDCKREVLTDYGEPTCTPMLKEPLTPAPWTVANAGGVQVVTNTETPHGYIRWDRKRILPIAIDGQHRLAALRRHYYDGCLSSDDMESTVSVLFLVLDARVGFQMSHTRYARDDTPIVAVVNELFTILNRHVTVGERVA